MQCRKCSKEIINDSVFCSFCGAKQLIVPPLHKPKTRGNGTGSVYRLPNNKWRAAVTLGYTDTGVRIYKTKSDFTTKKAGIEYLQKLKEEAKAPKDIKFYKLYEEWNRQHFNNLSYSKKRQYITAYKHCEDLYYRDIKDLKLKDFQAVIDKREGGYYPKHDIRVLCNLMFKYAMQNDYIIKSYIPYLKLPALNKSNKDAFTADEIKEIWDDYNNGNDFTGYILIMIYTGMRHGELKALKKENIFLDKNYMIGGIKTEAGINREIVIADKIKPIITKIYNKSLKMLLEMPEYKFKQLYKETLYRIGIRKLTPHCCRHTFATLMAEAGTQPAIIKELAGHEDYQTTLQYTHISLNEKLKAVNKI